MTYSFLSLKIKVHILAQYAIIGLCVMKLKKHLVFR